MYGTITYTGTKEFSNSPGERLHGRRKLFKSVNIQADKQHYKDRKHLNSDHLIYPKIKTCAFKIRQIDKYFNLRDHESLSVLNNIKSINKQLSEKCKNRTKTITMADQDNKKQYYSESHMTHIIPQK